MTNDDFDEHGSPNFELKRSKINEIDDVSPQKTVTLPDVLILEEILPRLPVKSLIRFTSVSKEWLSAIYSPEFVKSHLQFSSSLPQLIILVRTGFHKHKFFSLRYDQTNYDAEDFVHLEFEIEIRDLGLVGSCNGLVCFILRQNCQQILTIWNPATHRYRKIMIPDGEHRVFSSGCQFYYDSSTDHYKVFGVFYKLLDSDLDGSYLNFHVFSGNTGIWKRIDNLHKRFRILELRKTVLVHDTIYFFMEWNQFNPMVAFAFDLVTDQLKPFPLMNCLKKDEVVEILKLRGCLSLICSPKRFDFDVWMLKQPSDGNSWQKWFSFNSTIIKPYSISKTGMCLVRIDGQLYIYDPSRETLQLSQKGIAFDDNYCLYESEDYVESLVSPF